MNDVGIVGRSLVCALGHDVITACAAARAGISRISELQDYKVADPEVSAGGVALAAHSVAGLTHGFSGSARLLRLLQAALADLQRQVPEAPWQDHRTGVYLCVPDPARVWTGAERILHPVRRESFLAEAKEQRRESAADAARALFASTVRVMGLSDRLGLRHVEHSGHVAVSVACARAIHDLKAGHVELACVLAADSLLDEVTLRWLDITERLRTPHRPAGLIPGEAAGALVLERADHARARGVQLLARVGEVSLGNESAHLLTAAAVSGSVLAETLDRLRPRSQWREGATPYVSIDLNGEIDRAVEWGNALVHLTMRSESYQRTELAQPAVAFGDCGAASGVTAICAAIAAWQRSYARSSELAVVNIADGPERSALLLQQAS